MKPFRFVVLLVCFVLLTSCRWGEPDIDEFGNPINPVVANSSNRDLEEIKKEGVLRALIVYSSTSYFLYRGQPMGFEYELIKWLAEDLNLKLELIISEDLDTQFEVLNRGDVDIIAQGMTVTNQRKWEVDFTQYLYLTKQVLVQKNQTITLNFHGNLLKKH